MRKSAIECAKIFTTEPAINRALAAEMRLHAMEITAFVSKLIDRQLEPLSNIACEWTNTSIVGAEKQIDIVLWFGLWTVGLETKISHFFTEGQLEGELAQVDDLVVVVHEQRDARLVPTGVRCTTWQTILSLFADPRFSMADVDSLAVDSKLVTRRLFQEVAAELSSELLDDPIIRVAEENGNGGRTSMTLESVGCPSLADRRIICQIEANRSAGSMDYVATLGVDLLEGDLEDRNGPPVWIDAMKRCGPLVKALADAGPVGLSMHPGRATIYGKKAGPVPNPRFLLAEEHGLATHFAKGYGDSYVGVKSLRTDNLRQLAIEVIRWMRAMYWEIEGERSTRQ